MRQYVCLSASVFAIDDAHRNVHITGLQSEDLNTELSETREETEMELWNQLDSIDGPGLTAEQLRQVLVRCKQCGLYMSSTKFEIWHYRSSCGQPESHPSESSTSG